MLERLQKIISRAGIASRRHAEQLILSGAVTVNGRVITELGTKADADRDHITVGPRVVRMDAARRESYFAFHKPSQVVSTQNDPEGRPCLGSYLRGHKGRLFPVGRLEFDTAGLLLLTSDGELASDLMRAAAAIPQTWRFKVKGRISEPAQQAIEREGQAHLSTYRDAENAWYEATLCNAPRDLLRQTLQRQGILLEKMMRSGYGGVELGALPAGEMRELSAAEVNRLRRAAEGNPEPANPPREARAQTAPAHRPFAGRKGFAGGSTEWRRARGRRQRTASQLAGPRRRGPRRQAPRRQRTP